jgi:aspartate aminotransferase
MAKLSTLAETLIGSEIVKLGNAINERIKAGEKIYNYTIGDFNPKIIKMVLQTILLVMVFLN